MGFGAPLSPQPQVAGAIPVRPSEILNFPLGS
jgi:hypothetical protein